MVLCFWGGSLEKGRRNGSQLQDGGCEGRTWKRRVTCDVTLDIRCASFPSHARTRGRKRGRNSTTMDGWMDGCKGNNDETTLPTTTGAVPTQRWTKPMVVQETRDADTNTQPHGKKKHPYQQPKRRTKRKKRTHGTERGPFVVDAKRTQQGRFGHEFLEFEVHPEGLLKYANATRYRGEGRIRKEIQLSETVVHEFAKIIRNSHVSAEIPMLTKPNEETRHTSIGKKACRKRPCAIHASDTQTVADREQRITSNRSWKAMIETGPSRTQAESRSSKWSSEEITSPLPPINWDRCKRYRPAKIQKG